MSNVELLRILKETSLAFGANSTEKIPTMSLIGMNALHLGVGGCRLYEICAIKSGELCRHIERAISPLEDYGVNVTALAVVTGIQASTASIR